MVWLDFMHGGGMSPRSEAHVAEWAAEVRDNVRRVASHAALVMYAGNNEGVKAITSVVHGVPSKQWAANPDAQVSMPCLRALASLKIRVSACLVCAVCVCPRTHWPPQPHGQALSHSIQ